MKLRYVASRYDGDGIYKETRRACSLQVKVEQKSRRCSDPDQYEINLLPAIGTTQQEIKHFIPKMDKDFNVKNYVQYIFTTLIDAFYNITMYFVQEVSNAFYD